MENKMIESFAKKIVFKVYHIMYQYYSCRHCNMDKLICLFILAHFEMDNSVRSAREYP